MQLVENLAVYFAEFGVTATLDGASVRGIFDREYAQAFDGVSTTAPMFTLATTAAATATSASVLVVAGTSYRVRSVQPDGTGITLLILELQ